MGPRQQQWRPRRSKSPKSTKVSMESLSIHEYTYFRVSACLKFRVRCEFGIVFLQFAGFQNFVSFRVSPCRCFCVFFISGHSVEARRIILTFHFFFNFVSERVADFVSFSVVESRFLFEQVLIRACQGVSQSTFDIRLLPP